MEDKRNVASSARIEALFHAVWAWIRRHPWSAIALILAGFGIRLFSEIVDEFYERQLSPTDALIQHWVFAYRTPLNTAFALGISDMLLIPGVLALVLPMLIALLAFRRWMAAAVFVLVPSLTGLFVEELKLLFHRPRPLGGLIVQPGNSFPSGHATGSIVFYGLLAYLLIRYWVTPWWARTIVIVVAVVMIVLTGFARVYLQVHYPSDVAAGWGAGAIILAGAILFLEAWEHRVRRQKGS